VLQGHSKFLFNSNNLFFNTDIFENQKTAGDKML